MTINLNTETVIQISNKFHECDTLVSFLDLLTIKQDCEHLGFLFAQQRFVS